MDFTKKDSLALKGIAILMMYVHHFYLSPERWAGYTVDFFPLTESMTVYLAEFLKTCVCVFVFITGYGMTQSLKQKHPDFRPSSTDMLSYTRHRLVSLLSNFIFVYLLVILVSFPTGRFFEIYGRSGSSILYVLVDMFGLAKLFKTPSYVGTWWYMSLAIVLVVLFPLFVKLYREYRWAFLFAVMLLPRFLNLRVVNTNLLHYTLAMALGMYCAESDLFTRWKTFEETRLRKIPKILLFLFHLLLLAALVIFRQSDAGQGLLEVFDGIIPVYLLRAPLPVPAPGSESCAPVPGKTFHEHVPHSHADTNHLFPGLLLQLRQRLVKCAGASGDHCSSFHGHRSIEETGSFFGFCSFPHCKNLRQDAGHT